MRSTEDEDSPKGYRSPKPATLRGAGRKALFAGNGGQLGVFRQTEAELRKEAPPFLCPKNKKGRDKMITRIFRTITGCRLNLYVA